MHTLCVFLSVSKNLYAGGNEKQEINLVWPKIYIGRFKTYIIHVVEKAYILANDFASILAIHC